MSERAICFVIMPFGKKGDGKGRTIDFDAIYALIIRPAIEEDVGFQALRADEEAHGGVIHDAMFERLALSEYAIADLTVFNPNVYYELGVRHAVRPQTTVPISASDQLPFDVANLSTVMYALDASGAPSDAAKARAALAGRLNDAKNSDSPDSPLFRYAQGWMKPPQVAHEKTETFRRDVDYSRSFKQKLESARLDSTDAIGALDAVRKAVGDLRTAQAGVVLDLFLSYRAAGAYQRMIELYDTMDPVIQHTTMAREQYAFALNRAGQAHRAEAVLTELIKESGASSETYGLLGRIYKDRWDAARKTGDLTARSWADKAIKTYLEGFESDWRDAYPGINALTLISVTSPEDPRIAHLAPVVRYAVERKVARGGAGYWDHATLLELAVIVGDLDEADRKLSDALCEPHDKWAPESTARNLSLIQEAWTRVGKDVTRLATIVATLSSSSKGAPQ